MNEAQNAVLAQVKVGQADALAVEKEVDARIAKAEPKVAKPQRTKVNTLVAVALTATGLADALVRVTDVPESAEAQSRLQSIIGSLSGLPLSEGRKLLTDAVKVHKPEDDVYDTVKQRASEARQIYGAFKLVAGFDQQLKGIGWFKAVSAARKALDEHNINASGARIKSDFEKKAEKLGMAIGKKQAAEMIAAGPEAVKDQVVMSKIAAKAAVDGAAALAQAEVMEHAQRIIKAKGAEYAVKLADRIMEQITAPKGNGSTH